MTGTLQFLPLHWIYHDFWDYSKTHWGTVGGYPAQIPINATHKGHVHFFMPGYDVYNNATQQAFVGKQVYEFNLDEIWSPNSSDPNQQFNFRIVGKPKWYFYIEEFWRRIYLQNWENIDNHKRHSHIGKKGVKWDCANPKNQTEANKFGPFREHRGNYFYDTDLARTLPIEYWLNEEKTRRDHFLRYNKQGSEFDIENPFIWDYEDSYPKRIKTPALGDSWADCYSKFDNWTLPRGKKATGDYCFDNHAHAETNKHLSFSDEDKARNTGYPDREYFCPTIEYVCSKQLNFERLSGWEKNDKEDEITGEDFGDGYRFNIEIPYTVDGVVQSPFSNDKRVVKPVGEYFHEFVTSENQNGVNEQRAKFERLRFRDDGYWEELDENKKHLTKHYPTLEQKGELATFNIPEGNWKTDGRWVEQCLGAFIQAKVKVITEDIFGGRTTHWVTASSLDFQEPFEGVENADGV